MLLLDEPTNDLDVETLRAFEDLLDGWPGTIVVVSHDRWFIERVCREVYAIEEDGGLAHMPGGVAQYLAARRAAGATEAETRTDAAGLGRSSATAPAQGATGTNAAQPAVPDKPQPRHTDPAQPAQTDAEQPVERPVPARGAQIRAARKQAERSERRLARIERELEGLAEREAVLHQEMAENVSDYERLGELHANLELLAGEREQLEAAWIETSEALEG